MSGLDLQRVGRRLRSLRKEKGLSTDELAKAVLDKTGYERSGNLYEKMELGRTRPTLDALFALADFYDLDLNNLVLFESSSENRAGLEFIHRDSDLVDELQRLRSHLGTEWAVRLLKNFVKEWNYLIEECFPKKRR